MTAAPSTRANPWVRHIRLPGVAPGGAAGPALPEPGRTPAADPTPDPAPERSPSGRRDLWLDTLRAAALLRVVTYHLYGWVWLPALLPSLGIMFALAGSLMAASLDRAERWSWGVLGRRVRRLVPPLWLMGAICVPVMLWHGWTAEADGTTPARWDTLPYWVLPLADPPGSDLGLDWVTPLWYLRTYLWFVLLSPPLLWLFRRWPLQTASLPAVVLLLSVADLVGTADAGGETIMDLATYGACWMLGFAHHDGALRTVRPWVVVATGAALCAAGLTWAVRHPDPVAGWNLDEIPPAQACFSLGVVLVLLRFRPPLGWLARRAWFRGFVSAVNARAVTIYLWNNVAIFLAVPLLGAWSVTAAFEDTAAGQALLLPVTLVLLAAIVAATGWVEDVAARRRPRVIPWQWRRRRVTASGVGGSGTGPCTPPRGTALGLPRGSPGALRRSPGAAGSRRP